MWPTQLLLRAVRHPLRSPPLGLLRRAASTVLRPDPADLVPAADDASAEAAAQQPVGLSLKQRLRQVQLDHEVLAHIERLGLGMPPRGREHRRRAPEPRPLVKRARVGVGFVGSAHDSATLPEALGPEVAFAGRSNVGKSSLLNAVVGKTCGRTGTIGVAAVRNEPGVTRSINFYGKGPADADGQPRLVDLPGYGYAFASEELVAQWQATMRQYLLERDAPTLRVLLLVDARQSLRSSDKDFCLFLEREANLRYHVVMSKCDLVPRVELARRYSLLTHELNELQLRGLRQPVLMVSARTGAGINELRGAVADVIPVPQQRRKEAASAESAESGQEEAERPGESGGGGRDLVGRRLRDDVLDEAGRRWAARDGAGAAALPDWRITPAVRDRLRREQRSSAEEQQRQPHARVGARPRARPTPPAAAAAEDDARLSELDATHRQRSAYETWARRQKRRQGPLRRG